LTKRTGSNSLNAPALSAHTRKMSKDPRKSTKRQEEIFEAIAKVMLNEHSGILSLDEIASTMGASKGTIYYYFKTKGEMLYRMTVYISRALGEAVVPILNDKTIAPKKRLAKAIYTHMRVAANNSQLVRATWTDATMREMPANLRMVVTRTRHNYEREFIKLIREILEAENWSCGSVKIAMRMIFGIINSATMWYRDDGELSGEEISDYIVRCVFGGIFYKENGHTSAGEDSTI
jgi:AcrR family transcriptional regulator